VRLGEFELIDQLLKPLAAGAAAALNLEDDAAVLACPPGQDIVIAKDAMVAGVHFLEADPAALVGGKLLRVNLSDLAAMGADPLGYLTMVAIPRDLDPAYLRSLIEGLAAVQKYYGLHLLGGDTVSTSGPLVLGLTILGTVPAGQAIRRRGARPGDQIMVSGTLGDAALGLRVLRGLATTEDEAMYLVDRYRIPRPRLALGRALRGLASAAIDISDGLLADLEHITGLSGVGAEVSVGKLPLSAAARAVPGASEAALSGGDDYELLFTVPPDYATEVRTIATALGLEVTTIGTIREAVGLAVLGEDGRAIATNAQGWRHF
jgi:thiamine-monophosphate kinase